MYNLLMQIVLAARGDKNNKGENFIQILVFVVMAILWIVGGIAKARSNKIKDSDFQDEQEGEEKKLAKQPIQRFVKREVAKSVQKSGIGEKLLAGLKSSDLGKIELKESIIKPIKLPKMERAISAKKVVTEKSRVEELVGDFGEAGKLENAILHSEILGKPLALRRGSESIIGLG